MAEFTDEQQQAIDNLSPDQQAAIQSRRSLLQAEESLVEGKTTLEPDVLRDVKLLLRTQRETYRDRYRSVVSSFEQRYSLVVTKDGFEPQENPPVFVNG